MKFIALFIGTLLCACVFQSPHSDASDFDEENWKIINTFYSLGYCIPNPNARDANGNPIACHGWLQTYAEMGLPSRHFTRERCRELDKKSNGKLVSKSNAIENCQTTQMHNQQFSLPTEQSLKYYRSYKSFEDQKNAAFKIYYALVGKDTAFTQPDYLGARFALDYIIREMKHGPPNRHGHGKDHDTLCTAFIDYRMYAFNFDLIRGTGMLLLGDTLAETQKRKLLKLTNDYIEGFMQLNQYCVAKTINRTQNKFFLAIAEKMMVNTTELYRFLSTDIKKELFK